MKVEEATALKKLIAATEATLTELRAIKNRTDSDLAILKQYQALGKAPVYAAPNVLVSPNLAVTIADYRKNFVANLDNEQNVAR